MADGPQLRLQPDNKETSGKLQALAEAVDWVYSAFWKFNHETRVLAWEDGFYNGPSPTTMDELLPQMDLAVSRSERRQALERKQLQALASGCHKSQMEFYQLNSDDLSGTEWFYLMSTGFTFPPGIGMPGRVLLSGEHEWLNDAGHASNVQFVRSAMALGGGIQTVVCIAVDGGVLELGAHRLNPEDAGLVAVVKQMFGSPQPMCYLPNSPAASLYNSGPWEGSPRSILPRRLEFPAPNILQQAHQALFQSVVGAATSTLTEQEASHGRLQGHVHEVEAQARDSPIDCAALSRSVPAHIIASVWDDDMPPLKELPSPPAEPPMLAAAGSGSVDDPSCLTPVAPQPRSKRARLTPEALTECSPSDSCASEVSSLLRSTLSPLVIPLRAHPGAPSEGKDAASLSKLLAPKQELSPLKPSSQAMKHSAKQERSRSEALSMETSEITMSADEVTASFQHSGPSASGPSPSTPFHPEKRKRGRPRKIVHSTVIYHCMAERQRRIKENEQFETLRALVPTTPKCTKAILLADTIDYIEAMQSIISRHGLESKLIALIGGGDELGNDELPLVSATASCGTAVSCGVASQASQQKAKKLKPKKSKGHSQSTMSLQNGDDVDDLSTEYAAGRLQVEATAEPGSSVAQVMVCCEEKPGVLMDVSCAVEKLQLPLEMASFSTRTEGDVKIFVANMEVVLNPNQTTSDLAKSLRVALERSTTMQQCRPKMAKATSLAQKLKR